MRISLMSHPSAPAATRPTAPMPGRLLVAEGPACVLGAPGAADGLAAPVRPTRASLFGPRGAAMAGSGGPLVIADTGHHRLLVWRHAPEDDHTPADVLIGQKDAQSEGRNGRGAPGPATLNVPTGIAFADGVLAVADAWNHRVLLWTRPVEADNQPADVVLGQADFSATEANRGRARPAADSLNWCYGVAILEGRLVVCDTGNRRVLIWDGIPEECGTPASRVLGQRDFTSRDENAGRAPGPMGLRWPHGAVFAAGRLLVADAGNNRILGWRSWPEEDGAPADLVLGQPDFIATEHNRSHYWPSERALNMPYSVAAAEGRLIVADTANSRLLSWPLGALANDAPAEGLAGQPSFVDKGDNRWQSPARDSLCWPYGVSVAGRMAVIADSGNNRVLLWELAPRELSP